MTLPHLIATADLSGDTPIALATAWALGAAIVLAVAAFVREHQRGVDRDKAIVTLAKEIEALREWRISAERQAGEMRQEVGELRRLLQDIANDVKEIRRAVYQPVERKSA